MPNLRICTIGKKEVGGYSYTGQIEVVKILNCGQVRLEADNTLTILMSKSGLKKLKEAL
jgi:hypothetical protein